MASKAIGALDSETFIVPDPQFSSYCGCVLRADYAYRVTNLSTAVRLRVSLSSLGVYSNI